MPDDLITPAEAARLLGTSPVRVARMMARGELAVIEERPRPPVRLLRRADVVALAPLPPGKDGRPPVVRSIEHEENGPETTSIPE